MTENTATIERIRRAAAHIDVTPDLARVTRGEPGPSTPPSTVTPRPHRGLLVAACFAVVIAGGVGIALGQRGDSPTPASAVDEVSWTPPTPVPDDAPLPGSLAPAVPTPPPWLEDLTAAMRDGRLRSGAWVSMAIAQPGDDGYEDPIVVSVFDGSFDALGDSRSIEIDGRPFETVQIGAWQALATDTSPTLLVEGAVALTQLADVMSAAQIISNGEDISVALKEVPPGYGVVVGPQVLGEDTSPRRTLASQGDSLAINDVSDWVEPLLYAAGTGTDVAPVKLGDGTTAWTGTTNERVPLTYVVWSPEPGVVLEITTTDGELPTSDLIALANETTTLPVTEWEATYAD